MIEGSIPSPGLSVEVAQHSDPGRDPNKQINEDSCGHSKTKFGHLCVLCDGMGGHYGGQEASRCAIKTIFDQIEKAPGHLTPSMALKLAVEEAGRRVYELGGPPDNKVRPGSTVVAMLLHDAGVDVAHVGDSRAYVVRSNQIYPLTRDHSMVQSMIDAGFLTEEQAIGHPDANKITRALGMKPEVDVEVRPEPMELFPGDVLLQASDGLTDLALGHEILAALRQALNAGNIEYACQQLVRMANDRGGHDNITVQIARVVGTAPKQTRAGQGVPSARPEPTMTAGAAAAQHSTMPDHEPSFSSLETVANGPASQRAKQTIPMAPGVSPTTHDGGAHAGPAFGSPPAQAYGQPGYAAPQAAPHMTPHQGQVGYQQPVPQAYPSQAQPVQGQSMQGQSMQGQPTHAQGNLQPGYTQAGMAVGPTLGATDMQAQQGLGSYRVDAPQGLALPPPSMRYPQGASPYPPQVQQTPAMTPNPGSYGQQNGAQFGAQPTPWGAADSGPMSGPSSQPSRNVLFLWLGVSFFVATAVLIVVYVLVLR